MGPNITDWPQSRLSDENLLVEVAAVHQRPVTTTDELIPSGETSSYRSNPLRLAEFALSRRDPDMSARQGRGGSGGPAPRRRALPKKCCMPRWVGDAKASRRAPSSARVFANKPGDGSAREQAASCQRCWAAAPTSAKSTPPSATAATASTGASCPSRWTRAAFDYQPGDCVFVPGIRKAIEEGREDIPAQVICRTAASMTCCSTSGA